MRLRIDPTAVDTFISTLQRVADQRERGEIVEVIPGREGSGLVNILLRPLDPDEEPRVKEVAPGSMK